VRPERVVLNAPSFDQHLRLPECVEDLSIKDFVSELPVEALAVSVLPGAARFDEEGSYACSFKPVAYCLGGEFRAVIRSDMLRWSMFHEEIREAMEHIIGVEPSLHEDGEVLPTEFVDDRQHLEGTAIMGAVLYKIIGPDVVAMGGPEPDARPVVEPEPPSLWLFLRNLQPLLAPETFDPLMVDLPAVPFQKGSDPTIPIATVSGSQAHYIRSQGIVRLFPLRGEPLGGTGLAKDLARASLRYSQVFLQTSDASAPPLGA
jgi:hypothetical protein